jgi:hypothetical protein
MLAKTCRTKKSRCDYRSLTVSTVISTVLAASQYICTDVPEAFSCKKGALLIMPSLCKWMTTPTPYSTLNDDQVASLQLHKKKTSEEYKKNQTVTTAVMKHVADVRKQV